MAQGEGQRLPRRRFWLSDVALTGLRRFFTPGIPSAIPTPYLVHDARFHYRLHVQR